MAGQETNDNVMLHEYESEDIFDLVANLQNSFGIQFPNDAFNDVQTFGDLCDVFEAYMHYEHVNDCTKQQAFYKLRQAIATVQLLSKKAILPGTRLDDLFPKNERRRKIKMLKQELGISTKILTYPDWLALLFAAVFLLSLCAFFFSWKMACSGILLVIIAAKIAQKLGTSFRVNTIKELAVELTTRHYAAIRRKPGTFNKTEIRQIIIDAFNSDLGIEKSDLHPEARFAWTVKEKAVV